MLFDDNLGKWESVGERRMIGSGGWFFIGPETFSRSCSRECRRDRLEIAELLENDGRTDFWGHEARSMSTRRKDRASVYATFLKDSKWDEESQF